jgi:hypothetical protein
MATYRVTYWQEIPSQVDAKDANGKTHKRLLSQRFQELIDIIAVKRKLDSSDDYIGQWNKGDKTDREGSAEEVTAAVVADFEARYDAIRAEAIAQSAAAKT